MSGDLGMTPEARMLRRRSPRSRPGNDAFLDARAARIVEPDDGAAVLHGQVHDLADLLGEDLASEPPRTVKSCAKTQTTRPLIVP